MSYYNLHDPLKITTFTSVVNYDHDTELLLFKGEIIYCAESAPEFMDKVFVYHKETDSHFYISTDVVNKVLNSETTIEK